MPPRTAATTEDERSASSDAVMYDLLREASRKLDTLTHAVSDLSSRVAVIEQLVVGQARQDDRLERLESRVVQLDRDQLEARTQTKTALAMLGAGAGLAGAVLAELGKRIFSH
jgi:hypothetical protein